VPESFNSLPVAGKFHTPISHTEDLSDKLTEVRSTIKFQLMNLGVAVGHAQMTDDQYHLVACPNGAQHFLLG